MLGYVFSQDHQKAINLFNSLGEGKTCHYEECSALRWRHVGRRKGTGLDHLLQRAREEEMAAQDAAKRAAIEAEHAKQMEQAIARGKREDIQYWCCVALFLLLCAYLYEWLHA